MSWLTNSQQFKTLAVLALVALPAVTMGLLDLGSGLSKGWSSQYSVQVPEIDVQHKKLVDIINDLGSAMALGQSNDAMKGILERLGAYAVEHFAFEENLIRNAGYPDMSGHLKIHKALLNKFGQVVENFDSGNPLASAETLAFLQDWLINHIQKEDTKYTSYVLKSRTHV